MIRKRIFLLISVLIIIIHFNCSGTEKKLSESEKRLVQLAEESISIINRIENSENNYIKNKSTPNWKQAYQSKRFELDSLLYELKRIITECRFFEKLPEENIKPKAKSILHAAENIKMYITITNVDMSEVFVNNPPPIDSYSKEQFLKPAENELKKILKLK